MNYKAAAYLRLSKEEYNNEKESNSIINQRQIIDNYLKEHKEYKLVDYYVDDGYSGTNFDRPEFQRMLKDIKNKKIDVIIIKDLSRLGRNYIETGNFVEVVFPAMGLSVISVDENYEMDSLDYYGSDYVPLKNLFNDMYAKDISKKVRSSLIVKKHNGEFVGKLAPYGYIKDPKDKHKFLIDKNVSHIIKKIFDMILLGKSRKEIAEHLNNKNVLTPSLYKLSNENKNNEDLIRSKKWNAEIVNRILRNETYTGTLIQNIKTKPNYRTDKLIDVNKDEWIITENHHEPIISKDKFEEVQNILDKKKGSRNSEDILLSYLKCADCGSLVYLKNGKNKKYYYCKNYIKHSKCTSHSVEREKLYNEVLQIINENKGLNITDKELNDSLLYRLIDVIYINEDKSVKIIFK